MADLKAANVTKYEAGGSGDNYIDDGYIKSVEKVWQDSYTWTSVITSADTITIAKVPPNKKITSVEVYLPATWASTASDITVGIAGDTDKFIDDGYVIDDQYVIRMNNVDGMQYVTVSTTMTDIILSLPDEAITAPTAGTLKSIVRYT